jgi:hypothetical protein
MEWGSKVNYFWIVDFAVTKRGELQPVLIGNRGFYSEEQAMKWKDGVETSPKCEIIELPTRDPSRAAQFLKGIVAKKTGKVSAGLVRARHQKVEKPEPDYRTVLRSQLRRRGR